MHLCVCVVGVVTGEQNDVDLLLNEVVLLLILLIINSVSLSSYPFLFMCDLLSVVYQGFLCPYLGWISKETLPFISTEHNLQKALGTC